VDWLSFPCRVLTLKSTSEFQELQESGLAAAIMAIRRTLTLDIIPTDITGRTTILGHIIRPIIPALHITGTTGIEFTIATIAIIITTTAINAEIMM